MGDPRKKRGRSRLTHHSGAVETTEGHEDTGPVRRKLALVDTLDLRAVAQVEQA